MYETTYHRASSVDEAVNLLTNADEGKFLAGGQTLISTMKQRLASPSDLVDLRHIAALQGITVNGRSVRIGAGTTHHDVATNAELRAVCPAICDLASHIGDPHVRHMGTIGGSVANNDPAADYPAAILGLNATVITNKREIAADRFFVSMFETALEEDEIITAFTFDAPEKAAYVKFANPASRYAIVGVFVSKSGDDVRVAVTGAGSDGVFRQQEMEAALSRHFAAAAIDEIHVQDEDMMEDIHGTSEYRAHLVKVMAKRAVAAAG